MILLSALLSRRLRPFLLLFTLARLQFSALSVAICCVIVLFYMSYVVHLRPVCHSASWPLVRARCLAEQQRSICRTVIVAQMERASAITACSVSPVIRCDRQLAGCTFPLGKKTRRRKESLLGRRQVVCALPVLLLPVAVGAQQRKKPILAITQTGKERHSNSTLCHRGSILPRGLHDCIGCAFHSTMNVYTCR